jgi:PhoH-like ATPase
VTLVDRSSAHGSAGSDASTRTIVVLDTSALVSDPEVIFAHPSGDVVIPLTVIEELDGLKKRPDETGRSARQALRTIWSIIEGLDDPQGIVEPVALYSGGTLRIEVNGHHRDLVGEHRLDISVPDNRILNTALSLRQVPPGSDQEPRTVKLVSNDTSFRVKAVVVGIEAEEQKASTGSIQNAQGGSHSAEVPYDIIDLLHTANKHDQGVSWDELGGRSNDVLPGAETAQVNEYFDLSAGRSTTVIARVTETGLKAISYQRPYGLRARNTEQHMAVDLLMDPDVPVVALAGHAGTGKTLLALATGLAQTVGDDFFSLPDVNDRFGIQKRRATVRPAGSVYDRMMILRPMYAVGRQDIGFLPGAVDEKLGPWMEAVTDAMVALSGVENEGPEPRIDYAKAKEKLDGLVQAQKLTLEAVTFLRGRSFQNHFIVVDEAQNLEVSVLKTILTRVGRGTKVVFVGDTSQVDNPYASEYSNALAYLTERFSGQSIFGHLVLRQGERSKVADLAAELL